MQADNRAEQMHSFYYLGKHFDENGNVVSVRTTLKARSRRNASGEIAIMLACSGLLSQEAICSELIQLPDFETTQEQD